MTKSYLPPFNFKQWIEDNKERLKPPVCNKQLYDMGDFIIMVVGGPNTRKDYHDDAGEEFFYQIKGDMCLKVMEDGKRRDIPIKEGEVFLLPSHVYHSPQRTANSVGLVVERKRAPDELDGFLWFCDKCDEKIYEEYLPLTNIEKDLPKVFSGFWESLEKRTCKACGHVMEK
ncbi:MAG: 3-hydroxyanthranilate 3,4-dioxygenase [Alphaproteobacteria bacterium]